MQTQIKTGVQIQIEGKQGDYATIGNMLIVHSPPRPFSIMITPPMTICPFYSRNTKNKQKMTNYRFKL